MSYFKRFLIFALSALLIVAQPVAYAASPNGWAVSPADIIMNGATATVTAIKGAGSSALQSTVNHAPTVGNIGKKILKGAGGVAVVYAVTELMGAGVDWVLDPANNRVIYNPAPTSVTDPTLEYYWAQTSSSASRRYVSADVACNDFTKPGRYGTQFVSANVNAAGTSVDCWVVYTSGGHSSEGVPFKNMTYNRYKSPAYNPDAPKPPPQYMPISNIAQKVQSNAVAGHAPSQELIKTVVTDDVNAGALDTPLNINAVPVADAPPVNPPHDPTQPVPPFDPSSIISAIKSVMGAVVNMSGVLGAKIDALMIDLGIKQAETIEAITAGTGDIVAANDRTGAKVAEMVAAIEAIEGNTLDGQVINDAVDRVIANDNVKVGDIVAAIEGIEGNTLDGQVINDAVDRVIANDNANAQAAVDAATAADAANTSAVTDAIEAAEAARAADALEAKEAADAKSAADAAALEWAKEAPEAPTDTGVIVDEPISDFDSDKSYITFTGSCPPKYTASLSIMGATAPFEFDYTPICTVMSYLKPFIVGAGYIAAAYIIAGHSRGSKD